MSHKVGQIFPLEVGGMQTKDEDCIPTTLLHCLKFQIPSMTCPERRLLDLLGGDLCQEPILGPFHCCLSPWLWREFGRTASQARHREGCTLSTGYHTTTGRLIIFWAFLAFWAGRSRLGKVELSFSFMPMEQSWSVHPPHLGRL